MNTIQTEMTSLLHPVYKSIYLAGPFFDDQQLETVERVEQICEAVKVKCNSPRKFLVLKPKACWEERRLVFRDNLLKLQSSEIVLACLDGMDAGTLWEMGYAYAIGRPVVAFSANEMHKVNVMLAQGCRGFLYGLQAVEEFLLGVPGDGIVSPGWDYDWELAEEWKAEIQ